MWSLVIILQFFLALESTAHRVRHRQRTSNGDENTNQWTKRNDNPIPRNNGAIEGRYNVVLHDDYLRNQLEGKVEELINMTGEGKATGNIRKSISRGFTISDITDDEAFQLSKNPAVRLIEQDQWVTLNRAEWNLDRIDQRYLPLDGNYWGGEENCAGENVKAYVIDSGIKYTHVQFLGRAYPGYDFVNDVEDHMDDNGHGTHIAGIIGGSKFGVACNCTLVSVKVMDAEGNGMVSRIINALDWVEIQEKTNQNRMKSVVNMSVGTTSVSAALNNAVFDLVNSGVPVVVAAGNQNIDACSTSPAGSPSAITVAATDISDGNYAWNNFGPCIDIFAPGYGIVSAWIGESNHDTMIQHGTSMASAHISGVVAVMLWRNPNLTPNDVMEVLKNTSTPNLLSGLQPNTINALVFQDKTLDSCGNDIKDAAEVCDSDDLSNQTCTTQGPEFGGGTLGCNRDCLGFDLTRCHRCGDGTKQDSEPCDGFELGEQDKCEDHGYNGGGVLTCTSNCRFDFSKCVHAVERFTNLSGKKNEEWRFTVKPSEMTSFVEINLLEDAGKVDLYGKRGSKPTLSDDECGEYRDGNEKKCRFDNVNKAEELFVMLYGHKPYRNVVVDVTSTSTNVQIEVDLKSATTDAPEDCSTEQDKEKCHENRPRCAWKRNRCVNK